MFKLYVGPNEYSLSSSRDINEGELAQRIAKSKRDGVCPCIKLVVEQDGLNMVLQTAGCAKNGGGGRSPNQREAELFGLWASKGLNDMDFAPGNLISFLKHILNN